MGFWNKTFLRFSLIEWVVALIILLVLARFFLAEEATRLEDNLFQSVGLGGGARYLITVPLAVWVLYRIFKREQADARREGKVVVRPQVLIVSLGILALAIAFMVFSAIG